MKGGQLDPGTSNRLHPAFEIGHAGLNEASRTSKVGETASFASATNASARTSIIVVNGWTGPTDIVERCATVRSRVSCKLEDGSARLRARTWLSWLDDHHVLFAITVIVEGLSTLRGEARETAALAVPIRCGLGKAAIGEGGAIRVALVGVVAITNLQRILVSWNSHICRVALAPRGVIYALKVVWVLGAKINVVAVRIFFTVTTACAAVVGRGAFANIFQTSHVRIVAPS